MINFGDAFWVHVSTLIWIEISKVSNIIIVRVVLLQSTTIEYAHLVMPVQIGSVTFYTLLPLYLFCRSKLSLPGFSKRV